MEHTVSVEMANRLKEAGWPQTSTYFRWDERGFKMLNTMAGIAAPILTELLEEISKATCLEASFVELRITDGDSIGFWEPCCDSCKEWYEYKDSIQTNDNPCDAAAELWLWCKE